jgi:hypothetical protein
MRHEHPRLGAEALADHVVGIDIHPLSVLIAKTTVLLSLGSSVTTAKRPVTLHVYLANSLLVPRGTADLFESSFQIAVDNKSYVINLKGIERADDFDQLVTFCDELVGRFPETLKRALRSIDSIPAYDRSLGRLTRTTIRYLQRDESRPRSGA